MKDIVKVTAILGLVAIEICAIMKGIDGVLLSLVVSLISGIAGYEFKSYAKKKKR